MNPTQDLILQALATATGTTLRDIQDCSAFAYPMHRRPERDGWTAGLIVPRSLPAPDPAALADALGRTATAVRTAVVGDCLFLTILDEVA